jgi:hypothetical protein
MRTGKANLYSITLKCTATDEVEHNKVFLFISDYNRMLKRINEIVYTDERNNEWSLIKIEKL